MSASNLVNKKFSDLFSEEIERGRTSIESQLHKIQSISDKTSNILLQSSLQTDNFYFHGSKTINKSFISDNEIAIKYNFNRSTVKNVIKIVENYKKLMNLQKLNENSLTNISNNSSNIISPTKTHSEEFEIFRQNISNKNDYLRNSIRRLQFLLEKTKSIKEQMHNLTDELSSDEETDSSEDSFHLSS